MFCGWSYSRSNVCIKRFLTLSAYVRVLVQVSSFMAMYGGLLINHGRYFRRCFPADPPSPWGVECRCRLNPSGSLSSCLSEVNRLRYNTLCIWYVFVTYIIM